MTGGGRRLSLTAFGLPGFGFGIEPQARLADW